MIDRKQCFTSSRELVKRQSCGRYSELWNTGIFLFYIVPGVVATKIYRFLNPSDQQNYTDYVIELVTFSMFYFALFFV